LREFGFDRADTAHADLLMRCRPASASHRNATQMNMINL